MTSAHPTHGSDRRQRAVSHHASATSHGGSQSGSQRTSYRAIDRRITALALPTLATLLVEPLMVAADSAMVGHLGTDQLAGLTLGSAIPATAVGLCIFLAYATTATAGRAFGAGHIRRAWRYGVDGLWLALILGVTLAVVVTLWAQPIVALFGPEPAAEPFALTYVKISAWGFPGMLALLAAQGTLRADADARTPLVIATAGALLNIPLNALFIYGFDLGIAGAALGTSVAQTGMGAVAATIVARKARSHNVSLGFSGPGILGSVRTAIPLIVRTIAMRVTLLLLIAGATGMGTTALAAHQIALTCWNFAAYGLDSLATAAQILVGRALGSHERASAEAASEAASETPSEDDLSAVINRCIRLSLRAGGVIGVVVAAASPLIPLLFTSDAGVRHVATLALLVVAACTPLAALAYALDGVLIGANDSRFLAGAMSVATIAFAPCALYFAHWATASTSNFVWLWVAYGAWYMAVRSVPLFIRIRGTAWKGQKVA